MEAAMEPATVLGDVVTQLRGLLARVSGQLTAATGRHACELSRRGHVCIWRTNPPAEEATLFHDVLLTCAEAMEGKSEVLLFRRNMLLRAKSVENWFIGGSPVFPDEVYEDELHLKLEWEEQCRQARTEPSHSAQMLPHQA